MGSIRFMSLVASLLFAAAPACAGDSVYQQLESAYQRDGDETIKLARRLLAHPERLSATDAIAAHSYLCEALEDQEKYDEALAQSREALASLPAKPVADQIEFSARWLACAGFAAKQKKQFAEAMGDFDRAIAIVDAKGSVGRSSSTNLVLPLSYALFRRAGLHDTLGDHASALTDLTRAMQILPDKPSGTDPQDAQNLAAQRMNIASAIGKIHLHRQEYAEAAAAYQDVLRYTRQIKEEHAEAIIQLNLGECYRGLQRWQESQTAYARALEIGGKLKDQALLGRAHAGLGALARLRKDDAAALASLALAHAELSAAQVPLDLGHADLERAETLADMRDWQQLSALADQLVATFTTIGDKRLLRRALDLHARAAEGRGDLTAALADTRKEVALEDEIERSELDDELAKRNVQFDVARLEDKTRLLARENELANLQIRHDRDISLMQRAAIVVAIAIVLLLAYIIRRRVKTQRLLTRLAQEDPLTGLRNRRESLAASGALFDASRHAGTPFALALVDIDHFKRINDTYGHAAGDAVLVAVAARMRESLRAGDICGRVGGEEFLFVFPRCDLDHAAKRLEDIRVAITELRVSALPVDHKVTLSAGLTERWTSDRQLDGLVRRADVALYAAKHAGRDRIVVDAAMAA
jgi:diguanylate cyclase (GGDEF)-like protein